SGDIGTSDSYTVRLAQQPTATVYVTVSAAMNPQEEEDNVDGQGAGDSILLASGVALPGTPDYYRHISVNGVPTKVKNRTVVLLSTADSPAKPQTGDVGALNDGRPEGDRVVVTSHSVISADPFYNGALVRNVEVSVRDNDLPAIVVTQVDNPTTLHADNST